MWGALHQLAPPGYPSIYAGPFFDEIKLAEIALELDRKEEELMK